MKPPPFQSTKDLQFHLDIAKQQFRDARLAEPLEDYLQAFDEYRAATENFIEQTVDLSRLRDEALSILSNKQSLEIVRYLSGPLISEDDLNTLLGVKAITLQRLKSDPTFAKKVIDLVADTLDQRRFPWVRDGRDPTETEKTAAIIATAALLANRRLSTSRRHTGKAQQENAVATALRNSGWQEVDRKTVQSHSDSPAPMHFTRESIVGSNKADIVATLPDRRMLVIECKVSNSSLNSIKRLNDAKKKAVEWLHEFGTAAVVPVVVLSGVFDLKHLERTQKHNLAIFWAHDLAALTTWMKSATPDTPHKPDRK